jgi:DNA-binding MarR family transcriptional regulator
MRDRVPFLLYRTAQASHALANEMLARISLTARQVGILTLVTESGPMTQTALASSLHLDRTTMVELIDDLEAKGFVERRRCPTDRRAFLIHPTVRGREAKDSAVAVLDDQQRAFLQPLSAAERELLAELLNRLYVATYEPSGS